MRRSSRLWLAAVLAACLFAALYCFCWRKACVEVPAAEDASAFVTLTDAVPDAILEIRYFGTYNFVGTRIDGYDLPRQSAPHSRARFTSSAVLAASYLTSSFFRYHLMVSGLSPRASAISGVV